MILDEEDRRPAPVRIIKTAEGFTELATAEIRERYSRELPMSAPPAQRYPQDGVRYARTNIYGAAAKAKVQQKCRVHEASTKLFVKAKVKRRDYRTNGRGMGWSRRDDLTVKAILELQAKGLTLQQTTEQLNCDQTTLDKRLSQYARSSPEAFRQIAALSVCSCGKGKFRFRLKCCACLGRKGSHAN